MHQSSISNMKTCVDRHVKVLEAGRVLEVGSASKDSPYRTIFEALGWTYVGADLNQGPNVDFVLEDPYLWDIPNEFYQAITAVRCSSIMSSFGCRSSK